MGRERGEGVGGRVAINGSVFGHGLLLVNTWVVGIEDGGGRVMICGCDSML